MKYVPLKPFKVTVAKCLTVGVRDVAPSDSGLIEEGFKQLSSCSKYFRFLAARSNLTEKELQKFSSVNDDCHAAIGATCIDGGLVEPIGIARYARANSEAHTAEIAVTITDTYQGYGVGTLLLGCLAKQASEHRIAEFTALVHRENRAMRRLLESIGGQEQSGQGVETEYSLPVFTDPSNYPETPTGDFVRRAYESAHGKDVEGV